MRRRQGYVRDTLVRAQRFLDEQGPLLAAVNSSGARAALDDAAESLTRHSVAQREHAIGWGGEAAKQRALRLTLRNEYLRPIAEIAAALLGDVPEFSAFRLPSKDLRGRAVVTAACAMANAAEPYAATFVAAGLRPDFLEGLRALVAEMESSLDGRANHLIAQRASTIALHAEEVRGRAALALVDAAIQQYVPEDTQLLAEWRDVRRIPR